MQEKRKSPGSKASRRTVLAGGLGAGVLVALPDITAGSPASADPPVPGAGTPSAAPAGVDSGYFFLYGTTGPRTPASVQGRRPRSRAGAAPDVAPRTIATSVAARPVKSPDGRTVAFPAVRMGVVSAAVTLTLIDTRTAAVESSATLELPGVPADASVLVRPVFAGTSTVAVVVAVSAPTNWRTVGKESAGRVAQVRAATWSTHHRLAYLDRASATFIGPFHLADSPALAWTDAVADADHLYLWTMAEPAASGSTKAAPFTPPVRMLAFPIGAGAPVNSSRSPGAWPTGQTGLALATGHVVRVVDGRHLEIFSPTTRTLLRKEVTELGAPTAKPGATTLHPRPDGTLVMANAAVGRAAVLDPASSFRTVSTVDYPRPAIPLGGPDAKTALSPDGEVLYTLGPAEAGGLAAYRLDSGALVSTFTGDRHYAAVYQLAGGALLAVDGQTASPGLSYFSPTLAPLGVEDTSMYVAEVY
jgi:hypothetical protein